MSGLLGKFKQAATSPMAQGLLGAAAFGLNPALGLLAAPALRADRDRVQLQQDEQRERIKAARMQNDRTQRQDTAVRQLPGLLGSGVPQLMDPQTGGLLAQPGGQAINQQRGMSLLGNLNPEALGQGLAGQLFPQGDRAAPSDIRTMQELGIPMTPEGFQQFQSMKGGDIDDLLKRLQAEKLISERETTTQERQKERGDQQATTQGMLSQARTMLELNDLLEGTALEPGSVGMGARRTGASLLGEGAGLLGMDDFAKRQRTNVSNLDKFNKSANDFVIQMMSQLDGNVTNQQMSAIQSAAAGMGTSPEANRAIVAQIMRTTLDTADRSDFEIENRAEFESILERLSGGTVEQAGADAIGGGRVDLGDGVTLEFN